MQDSSIIEISHYPEPYGALFAAKGSHVKMPYFQERIVATLAGCITSIQAIYVPYSQEHPNSLQGLNFTRSDI